MKKLYFFFLLIHIYSTIPSSISNVSDILPESMITLIDLQPTMDVAGDSQQDQEQREQQEKNPS